MLFEDVAAVVDGVPHMTRAQGRTLFEFIVEHRPQSVLELGFASGVSTCYIAAALQEAGGTGRVVTVDQPDALRRQPPIGELLDRTGLGGLVDVRVDPISYTWELMRMLAEPEQPRFDFVFIDGAHTWDVDALAFLIVDRLLEPGGWLLFDDLDWTLARSPSMRDLPWVRAMPPDRQRTPQVRRIVDLLLRPSGRYDQIREEDGWAWAHRLADEPPGDTIGDPLINPLTDPLTNPLADPPAAGTAPPAQPAASAAGGGSRIPSAAAAAAGTAASVSRTAAAVAGAAARRAAGALRARARTR